MLELESCFDTAFDDVFQDQETASLFYGGSRICEQDLHIRFALSLFAGQNVVAPAQLLLDHGPFRSVLASQSWTDLIFSNQLLTVGLTASSLDTVIQATGGGTRTSPPQVWTTNPAASEQLREIWEEEGWRASLAEFPRLLPEVVEAGEQMKLYILTMPKASVKLGRYPSYRQSLLGALNVVVPKGDWSSEWETAKKKVASANGRSEAYRIIDALGSERAANPEILGELRRATIEAKHLQLASWVRASHLRQVRGRVLRDASQAAKASQKRRIWEVPFLGRLLQGGIDAEVLSKIARDQEFITLRDEFLRTRSVGDLVSAAPVLERLCKRAATISATPDKDGTVFVVEGINLIWDIVEVLQAYLSHGDPIPTFIGILGRHATTAIVMAGRRVYKENILSYHVKKGVQTLTSR